MDGTARTMQARMGRRANRTTTRRGKRNDRSVRARASSSESVPRNTRAAILGAAKRRGALTVGDAAAAAGVAVEDARKALLAIAEDVGGALEVDQRGEMRVRLPQNAETALLKKSWKLKVEPVLQKSVQIAQVLVRMAFGAALFASLLVVYTAIAAISAQDRDDRRQGRGGGRGMVMYMSPYDIWWYMNPGYGYGRRPETTYADRQEMGFLESVFSFVFGDGDPNEKREETRWKALGQYIMDRGGVVTAEEISLFVQEDKKEGGDEGYVIPALIRFQGEPTVDEQGNILYVFPALQSTAKVGQGIRDAFTKKTSAARPRAFLEKKVPFTRASSAQQVLVVLLGAANAIGVAWLSRLMSSPYIAREFGVGVVALAARLMPALQVYALTFFLFPAVRWFWLRRQNAKIEERNAQKQEVELRLRSPDPLLSDKLASARSMAKSNFFDDKSVIYSSERDTLEQQFEQLED